MLRRGSHRRDYEDKVRTMSEGSQRRLPAAADRPEPSVPSSFKTYTDIPRDDRQRPLFTHIHGSYTDTAFRADYLCNAHRRV